MASTKKSEIVPILQNLQGSLHFTDGQIFWQSHAAGTIKPIAAESVRQAFSKQSIDSGWIPPGVVRWGHGNKGQFMCEWIAPNVYTMTLQLAGEERLIIVPMPSLVWFGQGNNFYIWAAKQKHFTPDAELFAAPVPNVTASSGIICFGGKNKNRVEKGGFEKAWELFWAMAFNRDHSGGKSQAHKDDVTKQLLALAKAKAKTYPIGDLVPMRTSLNQAVNQFAKR
jgi:PRTRC genetic system protein B